ncbi:hypothetical protein E2C01_066772 [Portunus trituberculatus]|uniref:Uncharacterized protein n=1 Tax=Portunus trituberculatus TaxID=210409 RepID=A0A5B7HVK2_PORTR|nr:hypothetical protein [Portunus trituberculatus]
MDGIVVVCVIIKTRRCTSGMRRLVAEGQISVQGGVQVAGEFPSGPRVGEVDTEGVSTSPLDRVFPLVPNNGVALVALRRTLGPGGRTEALLRLPWVLLAPLKEGYGAAEVKSFIAAKSRESKRRKFTWVDYQRS